MPLRPEREPRGTHRIWQAPVTPPATFLPGPSQLSLIAWSRRPRFPVPPPIHLLPSPCRLMALPSSTCTPAACLLLRSEIPPLVPPSPSSRRTSGTASRPGSPSARAPRRARGTGSTGHLLTGLLRCGECGSSMRVVSLKRKAGRAYASFGCSAHHLAFAPTLSWEGDLNPALARSCPPGQGARCRMAAFRPTAQTSPALSLDTPQASDARGRSTAPLSPRSHQPR